jgi:hypothetical protein
VGCLMAASNEKSNERIRGAGGKGRRTMGVDGAGARGTKGAGVCLGAGAGICAGRGGAPFTSGEYIRIV